MQTPGDGHLSRAALSPGLMSTPTSAAALGTHLGHLGRLLDLVTAHESDYRQQARQLGVSHAAWRLLSTRMLTVSVLWGQPVQELRVADLTKRLADCEAAVHTGLTGRASVLWDDVASLRAAVDKLHAQLSDSEAAHRASTAYIDSRVDSSVEASRKGVRHALKEVIQRVATQLDQLHGETHAQVAALRVEQGAMRAHAEKLAARVHVLSDAVAGKDAQLAELGASHTRLADSVDALQQEMANMRAAWVDQERDVAELADAVQAVAATMRRAHAYGDGFGTSFGHLAYAPPRHQLSDPLSAELATAESLAARLRRKGLASQPRRATSPSVAARAGGAARRPTL